MGYANLLKFTLIH